MQQQTSDNFAGKSGEPGRSRPRRRKTITLKTLGLLILITSVLISTYFGVLYYLGQKPADSVLPVVNKNPPEFRFSIYEGRNRFSHPIAVAGYGSTRIYVSNNSNHTVEIVGPNGKPKGVIGSSGDLPGDLMYPYGIGILPNGNILIAETGNYRIQEFTPEGKFVRTFLGPDNQAGVQKPGPVFVDSRGQIYVGDLSGNQVVKFDRKGTVLEKFMNISYPHGIAVDVERNKLYVSDSGAAEVKVYELEQASGSGTGEKTAREPQQVIDSVTPGNPFSMVRGIAVDKNGSLYVADTISSTIRVFDKEGAYLYSFGRPGSGDGEFIYPAGVYVDDIGKVYIADWGNNRVQVWGY